MGTIRTLLAVLVIVVHAGGYSLFTSPVGVGLQLFYLISGFVISYVLTTVPRYRDTRTFYWSRAWRLYPIYLVVALLTLVLRACSPNPWFFNLYRDIPFGADVLLALSNLFMFGQDWVMFSAVHGADLVLTTHPKLSEFPLRGGLLVPQGWTLGLEVSFYLVAPFVLRDIRRIVALLFISLALRAGFLAEGLGFRFPWTHGFFPLELALFLLGALSQQLLLPKWRALIESRGLRGMPAIGTFLLIALCFLYIFAPGDPVLKGVGIIGVFVLFAPLAFLFQNGAPLDRKIGELSYPIYVGHFLVVTVVKHLAGTLGIHSTAALILASITASVCFAAALNAVVTSRVDAYRRKELATREREPSLGALQPAVEAGSPTR